MMVNLVTFLLIQFAIFLSIGTGILIFRLIKRNEKLTEKIIEYQDSFDNLQTIINQSNQYINQLDKSGAYKSDDELGYFFESLKNIQDEINDFNIKQTLKNVE